MKHSFGTASLSDLHLPMFLKEALWKTKAVTCKPAMEILTSASDFYFDSKNEEEALHFVKELVSTVHITRTYANEFFGYREGRVPDDVYYATIGRSLIELSPESFPFVPGKYQNLFDQIEKIHSDPDLYLSSHTDGAARYAYAIEKFMRLDQLLFEMQSNIHTAGNELNSRYNSTVLPIKKVMKGDSQLSRDIQLLGRKIDFIVNNLNEERFWYIQFASRNFGCIADKDFIFDYGGMPDVRTFKDNFYKAYSRVEDRIGSQGIEAFYEFAETVISPMNLVMSISDVMTENQILYCFSRLSMNEATDIENCLQAAALYTVSDEFMEKIELVRHLCAFQRKTATLWGDKVHPYIFVQDLVEYEELLRDLDNLHIQDKKLQIIFEALRSQACTYYNPTARENEVLGFQPYYPAYSGPLPAND